MKLLAILLAVCAIYCGFILLARKYNNPYKLITIFGAPGQGKTMYLTKIATKYRKRGVRVLSTDSTIPDTEYISPQDIGNFWLPPKSVLIIDEASIIFNNRNWKEFGANKIKWFKYLRHNEITIYCASQDYNDLDITLRRLTLEYWLMEKHFNIFIVAKRIRKFITVSEPIGEQSGGIVDGFEFVSPLIANSRSFVFVPFWAGKYDTYTRLDLPDWDSRNDVPPATETPLE